MRKIGLDDVIFWNFISTKDKELVDIEIINKVVIFFN